MKYELVASKGIPNEWRVESFDEEGCCYIVIFSGPKAKERAEEYLEFLKIPLDN